MLVNKTMAELTYTDNDKMVLQQFKGVAVPAKVYSKFTQDTKETWSYVLYESKLAIASSRKDIFTIQPGKYPQLHIVGCIKMCEQNNHNNVADKSIICADCRCFFIEEKKYIVTDTFLNYGLHMTRSKSDARFVCRMCCMCCLKLVVNRNWSGGVELVRCLCHCLMAQAVYRSYVSPLVPK
jgi:hypothetical protein